jgi:hypothetical protein
LSGARPALTDEGSGEEVGVELWMLQVRLLDDRRVEVGEGRAEEVGIAEGEAGEGEAGWECETGREEWTGYLGAPWRI